MGYNTKLAAHYVQLRITLTRLTSDYSERLHCSVEPVVYSLVVPQTPAIPIREERGGEEVSIYLSIHSPLRITHDRFHVISSTQWFRRTEIYRDIISYHMQYFFITSARTRRFRARLWFDECN